MSASAASALDPRTMALLKQASDALASAKTLSFTARQLREDFVTPGQLLTFYSNVSVTLQRPNRLFVTNMGDARNLDIWFDGQTLTLLDPNRNLYGQTPTPGTIDDVVAFITARVGAPMPLTTFLLSDPYSFASGDLQTAADVGTVMIDGISCEHLAFTEPDADWELWVSQGSRPLPLRYAVTYKQISQQPRIVIGMSDWKFDAAVPDSTFAFQKPAGAELIKIDLTNPGASQ